MVRISCLALHAEPMVEMVNDRIQGGNGRETRMRSKIDTFQGSGRRRFRLAPGTDLPNCQASGASGRGGLGQPRVE